VHFLSPFRQLLYDTLHETTNGSFHNLSNCLSSSHSRLFIILIIKTSSNIRLQKNIKVSKMKLILSLCTPRVLVGTGGIYTLTGGWVGPRTDLVALEKEINLLPLPAIESRLRYPGLHKIIYATQILTQWKQLNRSCEDYTDCRKHTTKYINTELLKSVDFEHEKETAE
jgi:hypothetical protein